MKELEKLLKNFDEKKKYNVFLWTKSRKTQ